MVRLTREKIHMILLCGLCLGLSNTMYATMQQNDEVDDEKENVSASRRRARHHASHKKKPKQKVPRPHWIANWGGTSIQDSKALETIIDCLQYWDKLNKTNRTKDISKYLNSANNYRNIVSAYHHLLDRHLDVQKDKKTYLYINQRLKEHIKSDIASSKAYTRNQRERGKEDPNSDDKEYLFLQDFLDTIYTYLVHGYDSGHRYSPSKHNYYNIDNEASDDSDDEKESDPDMLYTLVDKQLQALKNWQYDIKKKHRPQAKSKFSTAVVPVKQNGLDGQKKASYNLGVRLYYWPYFKNNRGKDWRQPPYRFAKLCVPKHYDSLKNEILAKNIAVSAWAQKVYVAKLMLKQSPILRKVKADQYDKGAKYMYLTHQYDIHPRAPLSTNHIMSIMCYTDFTGLCTAFGESFRYVSSSESLQALVQRNSKWYYLSRYLREAVECFGTRIDGWELDTAKQEAIKGNTYYHGVSYLLFTAFEVDWYGPISTSKQMEVVTLLANETDNGLLLSLQQCLSNLRFFNVSLLSSFGSEDERLFIGGRWRFQIANIRLLKDNINLQPIMHALHIVQLLISGKVPGKEVKVLPADAAIFKHLAQGSAKLPSYAQEIWNVFRDAQQIITIQLWSMYKCYTYFKPLLFSTTTKNLLRLGQIVKLFPNVTAIVCEHTDCTKYKSYEDKAYSSGIVNSNFILGLQKRLPKIPKQAKLTQIIVRTYKNPIGDECNLGAEKFIQLGWQIQKASYKDRELEKNNQLILTKRRSTVVVLRQ